jgi:hypothetical protein
MSKKLIYLICFVLVPGLTTTVANADIIDGLVGYWPLNEGGGTTTSDLSGNGNDGTLNLPKWDSGKFGSALNFDGVDDYVDCGNPSILDFGTGDFTISAWVKMPSSTDVYTVFAKGGDDSGGVRYTLSMGESNDHGITMLTDDNSDKIRAEGATLVDDGIWHHVVGMREGTTLRTSVDGVYEDGINDLPSAGYNLSGTSQKNALIGAIWSQEDNVIKKYFTGLIDDVAIWNRALTPEEISYLWNNGDGNPVHVSAPGQASNPYPADKEADVLRDVVLSWTPGEFAAPTNGHKVYFGENFNDVNDAVGGDAQSADSYAPSRLDFSKTYYWRVDEVDGPPDYTIHKGSVWSFTTEPIAYPVENITAAASSTGQEGMGPENTINGSGLDVNDLHSTEPMDMWLSSSEPNGAWIEYELDKVYKLHEMWVWNSNQVMEPMFGVGCKDVSIEYSVNGTDYTTLAGVPEFAQASGASDYAHNTTVDFGSAAAKYVRLTANSNWGGFMPQYGLSEVRFFSIPIFARGPSPDSGATDVDPDVVLGWRAGREAAEHDVYLSTDEQAVTDGNAPVTTVTTTSYGPLSLDLGATYYWKVNEVNMTESPAMWESDLWSFTTLEYLIVDDFEDYNDYPPDEIWSAWIDGYDNPINGSTVGYPNPNWSDGEHYVETTIVHGGEQAMPFFYSNTAGAAYSEGELTFAVPQDWTKAGIQTLVLYFYGTGGNTGQLYVKVNGYKVVYDGDAADIAKPRWKQWSIDLASFGVNLQNVTTLTIGIDGNGAGGTLYFDDIRLYRLAPETPLEIWFEAEAADSITEPMKVYPAAGVDPVNVAGGKGEPSGGLYIGTTSDVPGNNDAPGTQDIATYTFTVPSAGTYAIWGRVSNVDDDSLWVHIPDGQYDVPVHSSGWIQWNSIEPETADWHWVRVHSDDAPDNAVVNVTLTAGQHTILWAHRENENFLDAFFITDNLD